MGQNKIYKWRIFSTACLRPSPNFRSKVNTFFFGASSKVFSLFMIGLVCYVNALFSVVVAFRSHPTPTPHPQKKSVVLATTAFILDVSIGLDVKGH